MDRLDHALGRPLDPMVARLRNHYAVDVGSAEEREMTGSPFWEPVGQRHGLAFFRVTQDGRAALRDHLREVDDHEAYTITYRGAASTVIGRSPAKAKYQHWLDVSDARPRLTFKDYLREARVRRAGAGRAGTHAGTERLCTMAAA